MRSERRGGLGAVVAMLAVGVAVTAALAQQPGDIQVKKFCNADQCLQNQSTTVWCDFSSQAGCCCKLPGQPQWTCQCIDEETCLTSIYCRPNVPET